MCSPAEAAKYAIQSGKPNLVRFQSKAALEDFDGKTRKVTGTLVVDPDDLGDSLQVQVEVDLASLDTGISLRNKHMRENHLETEKYPSAVFRGGKIRPLANGEDKAGGKRSFELLG